MGELSSTSSLNTCTSSSTVIENEPPGTPPPPYGGSGAVNNNPPEVSNLLEEHMKGVGGMEVYGDAVEGVDEEPEANSYSIIPDEVREEFLIPKTPSNTVSFIIMNY